jgi:hypothetical protein
MKFIPLVNSDALLIEFVMHNVDRGNSRELDASAAS